MMKVVYKYLAGLVAVVVIVIAFMAFFMRSINVNNQLIYDGLGRLLYEPPLWAQFLLTEEKAWAGFGWHLIDILWFFGGLYLAFWLYSRSQNLDN